MIWTEHLCYKFYRRLRWYPNYCSAMQRFLKVTFSYQPVDHLEFKLWIMTKSKTKTKIILVEQINSSKTIILINKISKYMYHSYSIKNFENWNKYIYISHLVNTKLCHNDFIFTHLLILTFKSVFKGLRELLKILR